MTDYTLASLTQPARRRTRLLLGITAAVVVLAAGGVGAYVLLGGDMTVTGTMALTNSDNVRVDPTSGDDCTGLGPDIDVAAGATVNITDGGSATVGLGRLGQGHYDSRGCVFAWTAEGVTAGKGFYGVEVGHHGVVKLAEAELHQPVALTLG